MSDSLIEQLPGEQGIYKKRFVACLDLLGFSELVGKQYAPENIKVLLGKIRDHANILLGRGEKQKIPESVAPPKCNAFLMSDTIVLYSEDETEESFKQIVNGVYELLQAFFRNSLSVEERGGVIYMKPDLVFLPLRGAISYGEFYADKDRNIYFGKAFLDACKWEKEQNWIGTILTPDCVKFIKAKKYQNEYLVEYNHHFLKSEKGDYPGKSMCINWVKNFYEPSPPGGLTPNVAEDASSAFKSKYPNTFIFYEYCKKIVGGSVQK